MKNILLWYKARSIYFCWIRVWTLFIGFLNKFEILRIYLWFLAHKYLFLTPNTMKMQVIYLMLISPCINISYTWMKIPWSDFVPFCWCHNWRVKLFWDLSSLLWYLFFTIKEPFSWIHCKSYHCNLAGVLDYYYAATYEYIPVTTSGYDTSCYQCSGFVSPMITWYGLYAHIIVDTFIFSTTIHFSKGCN